VYVYEPVCSTITLGPPNALEENQILHSRYHSTKLPPPPFIFEVSI